MNGGVSVHVVDIASGRAAQGLRLSIALPGGAPIAQGVIDARGQWAGLADMNALFGVGVYEVRLQVAQFYRQLGTELPEIPFIDELVYRFGIGDAQAHYHLPFKITAWGVSCFRGGA
ncbi:hydroxyisourate hydrolase [Pseudomonas sp. LRP2-20]|uniref:hydroxyisourate hydrolase n=2 Tax=unclassified Pseudomonas TaxID=196821 RepID=UPI00218B26CE|nr:hydroxyisourate hydrolase [Pseudomonas sp. LRP2-20]BDM22077.1 hydroxyisourate hydrolase [Pseudomonas sp. LRP2-20]